MSCGGNLSQLEKEKEQQIVFSRPISQNQSIHEKIIELSFGEAEGNFKVKMVDAKESNIKSFSTILSKSPTSETLGIKTDIESKDTSNHYRTIN